MGDCPKYDGYPCGGQFPPSYCTKYTNVPDTCPYMCGKCTHTCGDKACDNGKLDFTTCNCDCDKGYIGDLCQTRDCPNPDPDMCGWAKTYCTHERYGGWARGNCPKSCGL